MGKTTRSPKKGPGPNPITRAFAKQQSQAAATQRKEKQMTVQTPDRQVLRTDVVTPPREEATGTRLPTASPYRKYNPESLHQQSSQTPPEADRQTKKLCTKGDVGGSPMRYDTEPNQEKAQEEVNTKELTLEDKLVPPPNHRQLTRSTRRVSLE
jgi:hypothetical protein